MVLFACSRRSDIGVRREVTDLNHTSDRIRFTHILTERSSEIYIYIYIYIYVFFFFFFLRETKVAKLTPVSFPFQELLFPASVKKKRS